MNKEEAIKKAKELEDNDVCMLYIEKYYEKHHTLDKIPESFTIDDKEYSIRLGGRSCSPQSRAFSQTFRRVFLIRLQVAYAGYSSILVRLRLGRYGGGRCRRCFGGVSRLRCGYGEELYATCGGVSGGDCAYGCAYQGVEGARLQTLCIVEYVERVYLILATNGCISAL